MPADVWLPSGWKNHEARSATQQLRLERWTGAVRQEPRGHRESCGRGWLRPYRGGRPLVAAPDHERPRGERTRMLHDAGFPGGEHGADKAHGDGVRGALPPSCRPCKGRKHPGCALRRACLLRRWFWPLRGGDARAWDPFPTSEGAIRDARGDGPDSPANVERRARRRASLRRESLSARATTESTAKHKQAPPSDHDRRRRGEEDVAHGCALRRRLQFAPGPPGTQEARRIAQTL